MKARRLGARQFALIAGALFLCGAFLAGCDDERVTIIRDSSIPIPKHATWAWRPEAPPPPPRGQVRDHGDNRPVISRDVMNPPGNPPYNAPYNGGGPYRANMVREPESDNQEIRERVRLGIERELKDKGFQKVSDPAAADFLVDYHFAVRGHDAVVGYPYGGYPGLVCGPFGCWNSWGWGPPDMHYEDVHFREGTFVFDFVKQNTGRRAYRAIGEEPVRKKTFNQDEVNGAMHHLLRGLKSHS